MPVMAAAPPDDEDEELMNLRSFNPSPFEGVIPMPRGGL